MEKKNKSLRQYRPKFTKEKDAVRGKDTKNTIIRCHGNRAKNEVSGIVTIATTPFIECYLTRHPMPLANSYLYPMVLCRIKRDEKVRQI